MTHEDIRASIAAYALHALAAEEARDVERHLASCGECRRELAGFQEVAASLAGGFPPQEPPAALLGRILNEARPRAPIPRFAPRWTPAAVAAAAAILLLLGAVISQQQHMSALRRRVEVQRQALALVADPSSRIVVLSGSRAGSVRFVFNPANGRGVLIAAGLQDPGPDLVYQVWLVAGATPESAGVFHPAAGAPIILPVAADFPRYQAVAVSVEHGPNGAVRPSAAPVLAAKLGGG